MYVKRPTSNLLYEGEDAGRIWGNYVLIKGKDNATALTHAISKNKQEYAVEADIDEELRVGELEYILGGLVLSSVLVAVTTAD
jgi:hypothetical protein